jgi:hypothetical protein
MNPFAGLLKSRKFWLLILDMASSVTLYFVGKYAGESVFADIKFLIATLQPVFGIVIAAIAYEDVGAAKAGATVQVAEEETKAAAAYALNCQG